MGAGASMDPNLGILDGGSGERERYYCHSCHRVFGLGSVQNPQDYYCPHCQSTFLEEIGGSDQIAVRHRNHGPLTTDQSRRITSATAMLRLLEAQLREELETLQIAFAAASARMSEDAARNKQRQLTKLMKSRLRTTTVTLDMACSQPSCPICSEDFVLSNEALRMPCSHIFHDSCVMPWLEMKQNCPICRAELSNTLPTESDLEPCSIIELKARLREFDVTDDVLLEKEKTELIQLLLEKYNELQESETKAAAEDVSDTLSNSSTVSFPIILRSGGGFGGGQGFHHHNYHAHQPLFGLSLSQGGFGLGAMENGSSMTMVSPSSMSYNRGNTVGPSSLLLQRRSIPFGVEEDDDDENDDDDEDSSQRFSTFLQGNSNINSRFGLRHIPAGVSEPSQIRMPWERPGYLTSQSLAELLSDDNDDDGSTNNNVNMGVNNTNIESGTISGAFNASSLRRGYSTGTSSAHASSNPSITYQIVPRSGGQGGYDTVAMRSTSFPATQLSSILLNASSSANANTGVFSTNATEGSASGEDDM